MTFVSLLHDTARPHIQAVRASMNDSTRMIRHERCRVGPIPRRRGCSSSMGARRRPPAWRRHCRDALRKPCATRTPSDLAPCVWPSYRASREDVSAARRLAIGRVLGCCSGDAKTTSRREYRVARQCEERDGLVAQLTCRTKLVQIRHSNSTGTPAIAAWPLSKGVWL